MTKTGPVTPGGKARASRNALKHGLSVAAPIVVEMEDPEAWEAHLEGMMASLEPEGYHEEELARRIAGLLWRLRRVEVYEANRISAALKTMPMSLAATAEYGKGLGVPPEETFNLVNVKTQTWIRMLPDPDTVASIARYEAHLHRTYLQSLHELEALQTRRNGGTVPLARLDITGPPG
jgi:hypothetical protein